MSNKPSTLKEMYLNSKQGIKTGDLLAHIRKEHADNRKLGRQNEQNKLRELSDVLASSSGHFGDHPDESELLKIVSEIDKASKHAYDQQQADEYESFRIQSTNAMLKNFSQHCIICNEIVDSTLTNTYTVCNNCNRSYFTS